MSMRRNERVEGRCCWPERVGSGGTKLTFETGSRLHHLSPPLHCQQRPTHVATPLEARVGREIASHPETTTKSAASYPTAYTAQRWHQHAPTFVYNPITTMTPGSDSEYDPDDNADNNSNRGDQEAGPSSSSFAPYKSFPKATYASVEYPSTVSQPAALLRLVSQEDINEVFNAPLSEQKSLEIRYGNMERNGIPVRGARVPSQKLLLKITRRRRRRRPAPGDEDGDDTGTRGEGKERLRDGAEEGIFTSEVVGAISQTVRFRGKRTPPSDQELTGSYDGLSLYS